ncbi:BcCCH1, calcium channel protein [Sclerotinia borealis F-4128]|uniref:Calcium-channel protein CCH1 n=1 Tax=Sclerotinia borealis (strain F-4128) TaxID=1432307 RepID=W9CFU0_SCLBF|nr:BcCCH1, calcium channel protein [Sclerotinia borealis F-4128]
MSPNDTHGSNNSSSPPQSIPLRDLTRPPDSADVGDGERRHTRGRSLLAGGGLRPMGSINSGTGYERLGDFSPLPAGRSNRTGGSVPLALQSSIEGGHEDESETPTSPVGNPADFQAAMGFAGLNVPDINLSHAPRERSMSFGSEHSLTPYAHSYGDTGDNDNSYFPSDSDRIPLTDSNHLQPMSGVQPTTPDGQRHDRSSFQSISFNSPGSNYRGSRLGDDLPNAEAGLSSFGTRSGSQNYGANLSPSGRRSRSPSTIGALSRAGSMVRAMSQRVVNLSGESEVIEESARRQAHNVEEPIMPSRRSYEPDVQDTAYRPNTTFHPFEKPPPRTLDGSGTDQWQSQDAPNPLRGNTLGIFSPTNKIRLKLCDLLVYPITEPAILILIVVQTVLLAVDAAPSVYTHPRHAEWGGSFVDYALLGLFIVFTLEVIARIIVSGFISNAAEYSTIDRQRGAKAAIVDKYRSIFAPQRKSSVRRAQTSSSEETTNTQRPIVNTFAQMQAMTSTVEQAQRLQLARRAFLRHSFNRLDFVAVVSYWAAFVLSIVGVEDGDHLYIFRMLSCSRILRLLALTNGTAIILRSLKKATPLLLNVSFLIGFFWLLFAIIGIQSFKGSLDRQCVWIDPDDIQNDQNTAFVNNNQYCGGQFNKDNSSHDPWMRSDGPNPLYPLIFGAASSKGYLCPEGSYCVQLTPELLPFNGTITFDNIGQSLELVFVIMTGNTFTDLMYYTTDSDYLAAAIFFAGGIVIMMLWLMNLMIAVITSSFQVIRGEGKTSAFAAQADDDHPDPNADMPRQVSKLKQMYQKTYWLWILIIVYDLVIQAFRSSDMSESRARLIDFSEIVVTFLLLIDIGLRFGSDWRDFHKHKKNLFDLGLAIITTVILLPPIRNSGQPYAWLTAFQILRIYRVVMGIDITRSLIMLVLGNASGIGNLVLFVFLITFLVAIFAVQLFRGEIPEYDDSGEYIQVNFSTIFNSFLGLYQILSSENWTTLLYNVTGIEKTRKTGWIGATFFIGWFILANFILVNMFIAVIQENFDVSEDEKRMQQVKAFLTRKEVDTSSSNLALSSILRFGRSKAKKDPLDYGPATMEMLLKDAVVKDFLDDEIVPGQHENNAENAAVGAAGVKPGFLSSIWGNFMSGVANREPNPFYSNISFSLKSDDSKGTRAMAKEAVSASSQRKKAQREYLAKHPSYNNALFFFNPNNPIRRLCQKCVGPGRGSERFDGVEPDLTIWYSVSAFLYACIVAMVLLACITTPLYQREYFIANPGKSTGNNWFVFCDFVFGIIFTVEALIKVIADGFFWTPNAYYRSTWGFIDGLVLVTLWINVITSLMDDGAIARAVGAFKALRALRLLNVSDSARNTFHSVILVGGFKVLSAAFVSMSLLIPFAIYGVNLFNGQLETCNDGDINNLTDCSGEYSSAPFSSDWNIVSPRQVGNPWYDFDSFGGSLFILFQIVSQEGWVDVMFESMSITGRGLNPGNPTSAEFNAVFFVIFNLLATVFILTLFISVFMRNYTEQTGIAFLTSDQRSWVELRKLLRQVSPSKRPSTKDPRWWKDWCYKRATRKHGRWHSAMTLTLVCHLILLLVEFYPEPDWWDRTRDYIFLAFTVFYSINVVVRIIGLTWPRFRRSSWDVFSIFAVTGTLITTLLLLTNFNSQVFIQLHKLFLVAIVLLLIPRNDALDQLFKTAAASLTAIGNLLATWFVLFMVFAIAMTQTFGLTRFGSQETDNLNMRTVPKTLMMLFRMSCGEGWNEIMEDYATISPPFCTLGDNFYDSDCGSPTWARILFISWNIVSMYIFTSLFVSLIYESFSYVFQRSNGLSKVSRDEIRRFKEAWAILDPDGTGFIERDHFPRLLGELSGVFEMRVYSHEDSVRRILEDIQTQPDNGRMNSISSPSSSSGIDLKALNARIAQIDGGRVRRDRARFNLFYEEVLVSADPDRGISFTTVLMVLAHYNVISDNKSLKLEEFLRRRARLQRVEEEVRRRIVVGFFDTMYWSRRFRKHMERKKSGRMTDIPQLGPEVYVDDEETSTKKHKPSTSSSGALLSPTDITASRNSFITHGLDGAPLRQRRGTDTSINTAFPSMSSAVSPTLSPLKAHAAHGSAFSFESVGLGEGVSGASGMSSVASSRRGSAVSAENVLEVLDKSAWGESIRRSFTMRRPSNSGEGDGKLL